MEQSATGETRPSKRQLLVTGGTGLVGSEVVRELVRRGERPWVLARGKSGASDTLLDFHRLGLIRFIRADLTLPLLGLGPDERERMRSEVTEVLHCAADYRLGVERAEAWKCNVDGTIGLLDLFEGSALRAFHHVSTVLVAGDVNGAVPETYHPTPGRFRNHYEETKWAAEWAIVSRCSVPVRIYRPGIILGHSTNGATIKFDGPYTAFGLVLRGLPFLMVGSGREVFPLVTVDLVRDVLLAGMDDGPQGQEFLHVLDGCNVTLREYCETACRRLVGSKRVVSLPASLARWAYGRPIVRRLSPIEPEAVPYMTAQHRFETTRMQAFCRKHGIERLRLTSGMDATTMYFALAHDVAQERVR